MTISIVTTTFYKSIKETRFHLACQMIGNARAMGHDVTFVDGSPDARVAKSLAGLGAHYHPEKTRGMGPGRRQAFAEATQRKLTRAHVWTEPEKTDLIRHLSGLVDRIEVDYPNIIVPRRSKKSLESYPSFQITSELAANNVFAELTGLELDVMFGPVIFSRSELQHFATCEPAKYGAADTYIQQIALLEAIARGVTIDSYDIDFFYPSVQRAEEEENKEMMLEKRRIQFEDLTRGFRLVTKALGITPR